MFIRSACAKDQQAIKDIVRKARINRRGLDWRRFIVVEDQGQVVGVGQIKPHKDGSRELASLALHPDHRGRGVGRVLVHALLSREKGTLYLFCIHNMQSYYIFFGFRQIRSSDMPIYFRRVSNMLNILLFVLRRKERVIVMRRDALPNDEEEQKWPLFP